MSLQKSELDVLSANNEFTKDMFSNLCNKSKDNIICSPLSAHIVLSMAHCGTNGSTKVAFAKTLHVEDAESVATGYEQLIKSMENIKDITLLMANKIFVAEGHKLNSEFEKSVKEKFLSALQSVNFQENVKAAGIINSWVKEKTKEKIPKLFEDMDITPDTGVVLANAIYFKGNWLKRFNKDRTTTEPFFVTKNEQIDCQMMHISKKFRYKIDQSLKAHVLMLPYVNEDINMVVLLPKKKNDIEGLEARLKSADLSQITDEMYETEVDVGLPKFKIEQTIDLQETLEELGLGEIFTSRCNFSGMLEKQEPLVVSKVVQKAFIEVNEEGTEAAAATGMVFMLECARINPQFYANHPFIILLGVFKENYSKILFFGKINKPVSGDSDVGPRAKAPSENYNRVMLLEEIVSEDD